jgi:hypothetical protein
MAESEIPADVMETAKAWTAGWQENGGYSDNHIDAIRITIARCILGERERCAEIVRPFTMQGGTGGAFVRKAMWSVLDAIRQDNPNET